MGEAEKAVIEDLLRADDDDQSALEFACRKFKENVQLLVGQHYSEDGSPNPMPDNKLALLSTTLSPVLAGKDPQVEVTTMDRGLMRTAVSMQQAFPERLGEVHYAEMSKGCLASSLLSPFAICEVGREYTKTVSDGDDDVHVTKAFVREVLFDDFGYDTQAKRWCDVQYARSRIDVLYDRFMDEHTDIKKDIKDKLHAEQKARWQKSHGDGTVSDIGTGKSSHRGQYLKTLTIRNFWCRESQSRKLVSNGPGGFLIKEMDYDGPEDGPFHLLNYHDVPGQILGLSPGAILRDIIEAANMGLNKAIAQAEIQKSVYGFRDAVVANTIRDLPDGHTFQSSSPTEYQRVDLGGAHQTNIALHQFANNVFGNSGYPLELIGGLAAQSPTATQDAILQGNAGKLLGHMAYRIQRFHQSICEHLARDMWDDELFDPEIFYSSPGSSRRHRLSFAVEDRMGEFPKYKIRVLPWSTMSLSPPDKWNRIMQFVMQNIVPAQQMMAQQGIYVNWPEIIRGWAKANGLDYEMQKALVMGAKQQMDPETMSKNPNMGPRQYERISRSSGENPQARNMEMANMLMGQDNQPASGSGGY